MPYIQFMIANLQKNAIYKPIWIKNAFSLEEKYRKMDALEHATDKGKVENLSQTIREYHRLQVLATEKHYHEWFQIEGVS